MGGSDRLSEVSRADRSFYVAGVGRLWLAKVCCHWSPGSGRILPLGLSCLRERDGYVMPGVDLAVITKNRAR